MRKDPKHLIIQTELSYDYQSVEHFKDQQRNRRPKPHPSICNMKVSAYKYLQSFQKKAIRCDCKSYSEISIGDVRLFDSGTYTCHKNKLVD